MNDLELATLAFALILVASMFSVELAVSLAIIEIVLGVLVETGLTKTTLGKLIMAATFITDLGTVTALSVLFITPTPYLALFALVSIAVVVSMVVLERPFFAATATESSSPRSKALSLRS